MHKRTVRKLHRILAPILFLPFFLTASTGVIYRLGVYWFGLSPKYADLMIKIHDGSFLGDKLRLIYVFLNGVGLIGMLVTGIFMTGIFSRRRIPE